ncbi:MAG TPA: class I SAM-dependent methyltransferase [Rhizomicrobium sp.]|jgi:SAM-dependent methyltransferase
MSTERLEFGVEGTAYHAMTAAEHVSRYLFARPLCSGMRVLDMACGEGYGSRLLAQWGAKEVVGVDISSTAVQKATKLFSSENVRFVLADACGLDPSFLSGQKFDLICCFETIEHVDDVPMLLRNIGQLKSEHGSVVISCPNDNILPEGQSNPFHKSVFSLDRFKSETERILGPAAEWFLGTPLQGYSIGPVEPVGEPTSASMDIAMTGSGGGDLWFLPSQENIAASPDNVDFFIGYWGDRALARVSVASTLSQLGFIEPWRALDELRPGFDVAQAALAKRDGELRTLNSVLESTIRERDVAQQELARRTADLRRIEIVLADERRSALNYRAREDGIYDLVERRRREEIQEIAKEVWWERNRRGLPYKIGKLFKRLGGS